MNCYDEYELKKKEINSVLSCLLSHIELIEADEDDYPDPDSTLIPLNDPEQTLIYYECIHSNLQSKPVGQYRAQAIWQELYAFFELDYPVNELTIESNLAQARQSIPSIIQNIMSINFGPVNLKLNQEIASFVKTLKDYSYLFTHRDFTEPMSDVYWTVDDALASIEYVESLYPSRRLLIQSHPVYASQEFESVYKTLILWRKTIIELMQVSDRLGWLYGFHQENYKNCWPWFRDLGKDKNGPNRSRKFDYLPLSDGLSEKRAALITQYVRTNKLRYRSLFEEMERFGGAMTRAVQVLQNDRCTLNVNTSFCTSFECNKGSTSMSSTCEKFKYQFYKESEHFYYHMIPMNPMLQVYLSNFQLREDVEERVNYGVNSEVYKRLGLPSISPLFFYLLNNVMDIIQTCMRVHLDYNRNVKIKTDIKYSLMCIEAYVKETRELIEDSIAIRQMVYHSMYSVLEKNDLNQEYELESYFFELDRLVKEQIKSYQDFIRLWCEELVKIGNYAKAVDVLDTEWTFCKNYFHYVTSSEDLHAGLFSEMLIFINKSLLTVVDNVERDYKDPLIKYVREEITDSTCMQPNLREKLFGVNLRCNELKTGLKDMQNVFEIVTKFGQRLINDIEIVAKYEVTSSVQHLLDKLASNKYARIVFKSHACSFDSKAEPPKFMVFVPREFIKEKIQVVRLLFINNEIDELEELKQFKVFNEPDSFACSYTINASNQLNGYLLYLQLPMNQDFEWKGHTIDLYATMPIYSSLHDRSVLKNTNTPKLILLTGKQSILEEKRAEVEGKLGEDCLHLYRKKTSFHPNFDIESIIDNIKESMLQVRKATIELVFEIETDLMSLIDSYQPLNNEKLGERSLEEILRLYFVQVCRLSYTLCLRFEVVSMEMVTRNKYKEVTKTWLELFLRLLKFFQIRGERLFFSALYQAIEMIQVMRDNQGSFDESECHAISTAIDALFFSIRIKLSMLLKIVQTDRLGIKYKVAPSKSLSPRERFKASCSKVDLQRRSVLLDKRYIGKAWESERSEYKIQPSEVSFRWQTGIQIGKGRFGIVYSCVNLDTGGIMALKLIYLHKIMKKKESEKVDAIADEINNVLRIEHPNLVKMFGAELNRTSIYIFMEYCGINCTLEKLCKQTCGLSEELVRSYTNQLLRAVEALHDKQIIHRDIKPQNIFLKEIDPDNPKYLLKLGDFGCSFNFNNANETFKANEIVGTPYYMAPEVMLSESLNDCYSYSADIWSVGCVVIEMWTGTRPWYPLEPFQISMKLCIDKTSKPQYPTEIKDEAIKFLDRCIQYEPEDRGTAEQLLSHSFLKISM